MSSDTDNNPATEPVPEGLAELNAELRGAERAVLRRTDPGATALLVSIVMLVLIVSMLLPWGDGAPGWHVLAGIDWLGPLPRLFTFTSLAFGLVLSALALATRWWVLAWLCAAGGGIAVINGVWSLWSRQVEVPYGGTGPGVGMVLALISMVLLAANWARIALRR